MIATVTGIKADACTGPSALHSMVATTVPGQDGTVLFVISLEQGIDGAPDSRRHRPNGGLAADHLSPGRSSALGKVAFGVAGDEAGQLLVGYFGAPVVVAVGIAVRVPGYPAQSYPVAAAISSSSASVSSK